MPLKYRILILPTYLTPIALTAIFSPWIALGVAVVAIIRLNK